MVDLIVIIATVLIAVLLVEKAKRDVEEELDYLYEKVEQQDKDIKAIADAINIYSTTISGSVEEKVKANVDLFSEWVNGEEIV